MSLQGMVDIGNGNSVEISRIILLADVQKNQLEPQIKEADKNGKLVNPVVGQKVRTVLFTDSHQLILSTVRVQTLISRIERKMRFQQVAASIDLFKP